MSAGVETMFSGNNVVPWHSLGKIIPGLATAAEAVVFAGLDWLVEKRASAVNTALPGQDAVWTPVGNEYYTVRTDRVKNNVLGRVKGRYTPVQNNEAFDFFNSIVSEKEAMYHTAGSLHGGKVVWILAELPKEFKIVGEDSMKTYVLLTNNHDGLGGVRAKPTNVRVVCQNTLWAAMRDGNNHISIQHSTQVHERLREAHKLLGIVNTYYEDLADACRAMTRVQMQEGQVKAYFEEVFGEKKAVESRYTKLDRAMDMFETGTGMDLPGVRGTLWAAYNVVTEMVDHKVDYDTPDTRFQNALIQGLGAAAKMTAYDSAMRLVRLS